MEKRTTYILAGIIIGIILGVEAIQYADARICPSKTCVETAEITPISDRGYFPQAHKALQAARETIHMAQFELKYYKNYPNSSATILVQDLIEAKNRGVEVIILVDEFSTESNAFQLLKDNGIEIKMDSENVTTHAKLIIVDGETVILGSTNLSFYGLEKNNEINVEIKDRKTAEYYEQYFWELWNGEY
ncbi:MAG: phospholipase D-like domain-containing protein [Candidatus Altiarchaeota archaeon]|nr:phospholipase D-like domain-containing protein [Candidatus Altiarchaeota archaeon]